MQIESEGKNQDLFIEFLGSSEKNRVFRYENGDQSKSKKSSRIFSPKYKFIKFKTEFLLNGMMASFYRLMKEIKRVVP